jgi:phenylpropionate dioxygenase-like ring-hydroxylating dioxygenase large terminal subunit
LQPFYCSPSIFVHDIDRIFMRHWLCAGHISQAAKPGDYFTCNWGEESVIVVRGRDHGLRAFVNVCPHRGSRICTKAEGNASVLVCPYHAWAFNLDGTMRTARHMPMRFDKSQHGLRQINLRVAEGLVFVSFASQPLSFDRAAAAISSAFRAHGWANAKVAHRETYRIEANWKLAVENYVECYHCGPAHPEYAKLHALEQPLERIQDLIVEMDNRTCALGIDIKGADAWVDASGGTEAVRSFRYPLYKGVRSGSSDGGPVAPLMGDFRDYDGGVTALHCGPASFFAAYNDYGVIYRIAPRGPLETDMELVWLIDAGAAEGRDYNRDGLIWLWRVTTEADKQITENNQRGVRSRFYRPGPYSPMEPNAKRFADWYLKEISCTS